ncbi:46 kDa FK506-binding nuclear protein [Holothuria leucospilota]|uniref:46 kDa FK506-binding nuclear protein n=1 Tax=Holothuria leucospilota TaxID=206669 RepID=A0A9Q1CQ35_HOLLE|nr:46 kDa FK506-binding nuclear protein [Holothuria leucospilota]
MVKLDCILSLYLQIFYIAAMLWGVTLHPGVPYTWKVTKQEFLTLASLDCRPQMNTEIYKPMAHLVVKVNNCEYTLCYLEKGIAHQQSLDFIFQDGDNLTLVVEGTGVMHITGYSVRHTMYEDEEEDRTVTSPKRVVLDGIQDDLEPPTLTFMGQPNTIDENCTPPESRTHNIKAATVGKSCQSQGDQIPYQDIDCELIGGTFANENCQKVDSRFHKAAEKINHPQGGNATTTELGSHSLDYKTLPQITNVRTEAICTEELELEAEESFEETNFETHGDGTDHLNEASANKSEIQSEQSMNMSGEHPDSNANVDLSSELHGSDERSSGTIYSEYQENQIQCSSNKDVHISSGTTLSSDAQAFNLCSNLTDSAESRSHEELFIQASVQQETTDRSNHGTQELTPHKDIDCERMDGTTVCEEGGGVESLFQKSTQGGNHLQTANKANEEFESSSSKEIFLQVPNCKTESFLTDDCRSEMNIGCVGSDIDISGEVSYDHSKTIVNKRDDSYHSMNMSGEDVVGISDDDSNDGDIGEEERLFDSTETANQEPRMQ